MEAQKGQKLLFEEHNKKLKSSDPAGRVWMSMQSDWSECHQD